ncbi:PTS sugar transporter subunit IIA [Kallotenue papyrolyticum]|uniref:PTS sugar transporter subunit IIA n=1 Tax=Kallotenue papyrolyticum TaxID=1325125 RepID=UPI0004928B30|nr:PTS sugar transporter subunit IIA [Kallotenue papyrolyticum]
MGETSTDLTRWLAPQGARAQLTCGSWQAAVTAAIKPLVAIGAVDEPYLAAVLERERTFPTGLPTEPYGVALPHASGPLRRAALSLISLREPVVFGQMGAPDEQVAVRLVIGLAVEPRQQVATLDRLIRLIQQPGFLQAVVAAPDDAALYRRWQQWTSAST